MQNGKGLRGTPASQAGHAHRLFLPPSLPHRPALCLNTGHRTAKLIQPQCEGKCWFAWWIPEVKGTGMRESYSLQKKEESTVLLFVSITHRQIQLS